ncbi:MAG: preprotein translocase subunit SecG [Thermodesulfobacteriota bacterium]
MIWTLILVIHIVVCIAMILIILLQTGKGADIGAAFGGGSSQTVFGSTGATTFLSKITIAAAVVFMCTSFVLSYFAGKSITVSDGSLMSRPGVEQTLPVTPGGGARPEGAVPQPSEGQSPTAAPGGEGSSTPSGDTSGAGSAGTSRVPSTQSEGAGSGAGSSLPGQPPAEAK